MFTRAKTPLNMKANELGFHKEANHIVLIRCILFIPHGRAYRIVNAYDVISDSINEKYNGQVLVLRDERLLTKKHVLQRIGSQSKFDMLVDKG